MLRVLTVILVLASCEFAGASDSRTRGRATEAYHQRLSDIIDSTPTLAAEKLTAYGGAAVHFSFRIDAAGRISRLRLFAEEISRSSRCAGDSSSAFSASPAASHRGAGPLLV